MQSCSMSLRGLSTWPAPPLDIQCLMNSESSNASSMKYSRTKQAEHHRKWAKKNMPIIANSAKTSERHAAGLDQTCGTSRRPILDEIEVIEKLGMKRNQKSSKLPLEWIMKFSYMSIAGRNKSACSASRPQTPKHAELQSHRANNTAKANLKQTRAIINLPSKQMTSTLVCRPSRRARPRMETPVLEERRKLQTLKRMNTHAHRHGTSTWHAHPAAGSPILVSAI